jgi:amidohydrolase
MVDARWWGWGLIDKYSDLIVDLRRDIHMHPEPGKCEFRTSALVADMLEKAGLEVRRGVAGTGVVALLKGSTEGKTVALRADMDAIPIQDLKGTVYCSRIPGMMHACGHDAHTAILVGAAMVLMDIKDRLRGSVKFIFQPDEEGDGGARPMIDRRVLDDPKVDAIFGLHVSPEIPAGMVGICDGVTNAGSESFEITVRGSSSHGAYPHKGVDAINIAAQLIVALQSIVGRRLDPLESGVLTIGTVSGGIRENIIADRVVMTGTIRTLDRDTGDKILEEMNRIAGGICKGMGGHYTLFHSTGYPVLENDSQMAALVRKAASKVVGDKKTITIRRPSMGVEDFAFFLKKVPGAFWRLGTGGNKGQNWILHNPYFDIDENALATGVAVHVQTVLDFLEY